MHKIVKLFHGSNVVPDVLEAGKFYHDFLGSWVYEAQFLEFEGSRNGANLMGGTFSLETLAPVDPNGDAPSARFLKRHGAHFINIAFWVEDIRGLAQHLLDNGVRVALPRWRSGQGAARRGLSLLRASSQGRPTARSSSSSGKTPASTTPAAARGGTPPIGATGTPSASRV